MIRILLHQILIKPDEPELKTESGIIISLDDKKERRAVEYGTVIQIGPTAFLDYGRNPDILSKGDKVCFSRYAGKEVKDVDGEIYFLINDIDCLCVLV